MSFLPIRELNPGRRDWAIKARCSTRTPLEVKTAKSGNSFEIFSADFIDSSEGEVRCKFMGENAKTYDSIIQKGGVFEIRGSRLDVADSRYNNLSCRYEINIGRNDKVIPSSDDAGIKSEVFNFKTLRDVQKRGGEGFATDLAVVIKSVEDVKTITTRATNQELTVRKVVVADDSEIEMDINLWAEHSQVALKENDVVTIKNVQIKVYNGAKSANTIKGSELAVISNPESHPSSRVQALVTFWAKALEASGGSVSFSNLSEFTRNSLSGVSERKIYPVQTFEEIAAAAADLGSYATQPHEAEVFCRIRRLQIASKGRTSTGGNDSQFNDQSQSIDNGVKSSNVSYTACPTCRRKVTVQGSDTQTYCEKCAKQVTPAPVFLFRVIASDNTQQQYVTVYSTAANKFFAIDAKAAVAKEEEGYAALKEAFDPSCDSNVYKLKVRAKQEVYTNQQGEQSRTRIEVNFADKLTDNAYGHLLLKQLHETIPAVREVLGVSGGKRAAGRLSVSNDDNISKQVKVEAY